MSQKETARLKKLISNLTVLSNNGRLTPYERWKAMQKILNNEKFTKHED